MKLKMEIRQILGVALQSIVLCILSCLVILHMVLTSFYYGNGNIIWVHGGFSGTINLLSLATGLLFWLILCHFLLKDAVGSISLRISENRLTRRGIISIWLGIATVFILAGFCSVFYFASNGGQANLAVENLRDISPLAQPLLMTGFLLSILSYIPINRLYRASRNLSISCSSRQLRTLALNASIMKWLAFIAIMLSGWLFLPLIYYYAVLFPTAFQKLKQM